MMGLLVSLVVLFVYIDFVNDYYEGLGVKSLMAYLRAFALHCSDL